MGNQAFISFIIFLWLRGLQGEKQQCKAMLRGFVRSKAFSGAVVNHQVQDLFFFSKTELKIRIATRLKKIQDLAVKIHRCCFFGFFIIKISQVSSIFLFVLKKKKNIIVAVPQVFTSRVCLVKFTRINVMHVPPQILWKST